MDNMKNAIVLNGVTKTIKKRVVLNNISFTLEKGGIYGFYGHNGSGKSMLFRAISGLIKLDHGKITVFGKEIGVDISSPKSLGIIVDTVGFWGDYTGYKNLCLLASIKKEISNEQIKSAIKRVGLDPDDKRVYRKYSLGMKQRLAIAQAIMEVPDLIILDEPTNALDEAGIELIRNIILSEKERGATVLLASHNMEDINLLCDRKFKINDGKLEEVRV